MPATESEPQRKYMSAGLHLAKIVHLAENLKETAGKKEVICDRNNNPSIKVTFENKAGEQIDQVYFYSTYPLGDPRRKDDKTKCRSEFKLHRLKEVLGFGNADVPVAEVKKKKLWIAIAHQIMVDNDGNQLFKEGKPRQFNILKDVFPYKKEEANGGRPVLSGDPETDKDHFLMGYFYDKKVDKSVSSATASSIAEETEDKSETGGTPINPVELQDAGGGEDGDW